MACQFTENNLSNREKRNMTKQVTAVIPHLVVDDAAAVLEFYKKALGAEEVMRLPAEDGKRLMHSEMKVGEARIFVRDAFPEHCPAGGANGGKDGSPKVYGGTAVTLPLQEIGRAPWRERVCQYVEITGGGVS